MPDNKKHLLTPEELLRIGIGDESDTTTPEPTSPRRYREGWLPTVGATATRLGAGVLSGIVGAVPSFVTTPSAAAIGGAGEYAAEKIESPDDADPARVGLEAGLSAIPLGKVYKAIKGTTSVGRQILANVVRGGALAEVGNMARRVADTKKLADAIPRSVPEAMWDVGTTALGGGIGLLGKSHVDEKIANSVQAAAQREAAAANPYEKLTTALNDKLANGGPVQHGPAGELALARNAGETRTYPLGTSDSPVVRPSVKPNAPKENLALSPKGRVVENPIANAQHIEEAAQIAGGVEAKQKRILSRPTGLKAEQLGPDGKAITPAGKLQSLDEEIQKATELAKAQRTSNEQARKAEDALKRAEQTADVQDTRTKLGGTDIGKIKAGAAKVETAQATAAQKAADKAAAVAEQKAKIAEAQKKIDALLESGDAVVGPRTLTESTVSVPTDSGKQTLRQTIVEKLKDENPDAGDRELLDINPRGPGPIPPAGPVHIPITDPEVVGKTIYPTKARLMDDLAGAGRRGAPKRIGKGKWIVEWADAKPGETPAKAPEAPTTVPEAPVEVPKTETPAPAVETPVEAPKALPEASKPVAAATPAVTEQDVAAELQKWTPAELTNAKASTKNPKMLASIETELARRAPAAEIKAPEAPPAPPEAPAAPVPVKPLPKGPAPKGGAAVVEPTPNAGGKLATITPKTVPTVAEAITRDRFLAKVGDPSETSKKIEDLRAAADKLWDNIKNSIYTTKNGKLSKVRANVPAEARTAQKEVNRLRGEATELEITLRKQRMAHEDPHSHTRPDTLKSFGFEVPEKPVTAPPKAAVVESTPKPKVPLSVASTKVTVDLQGVTTGAEVKRRVLNELEKYKKIVTDAGSSYTEVSGKTVNPRAAIKPLTIEVPNGPTMTVNPDQVENSINRISSGKVPSSVEGAGPLNVHPDKIWDDVIGLKDTKPRTNTINTNYGENFNTKGDAPSGKAPSYKIPVVPFAQKGASYGERLQATADAAAAKVDARNAGKGASKAEAPLAAAAEKLNPDVQARHVAQLEKGVAARRASIAQTPATDTHIKLADLNDKLLAAGDKYYSLKGKAPEAEVREAGAAASAARRELANAVREARAAGESIPTFIDQEAVTPKAVEPKVLGKRGRPAKGLTSEDLTKMAPKEQATALADAVTKFKKLAKSITESNASGGSTEQWLAGKSKKPGGSETGASTIAMLTHVGMGSAGAVAGYKAYPDDPITGALIGFGAGFGTSAAFHALVTHLKDPNLDPALREKSGQKAGEWLWDKANTVKEMLPDYYRGAMLSRPYSLAVNSFVGPFGSALMGAVEAAAAGDERGMQALKGLWKFPKEFFGPGMKEAADLVGEVGERSEGMAKSGPQWFRNAVARPAQAMTAGDVAARNILMDAGFSEAEARTMTMTSEPKSTFGGALGSFRKFKGVDGKQSFMARMFLPFYRTNMNQLEQSWLRMPGAGLILRKMWQLEPQSTRKTLVQNAMTLGVGGVSYEIGANTPKKYQSAYLKFISDFGGVYGSTAALAFVAGAAAKNGDTKGQQAVKAMTSFVRRDMPLPSPDLAYDTLKAAKDILNGKQPSMPYGVVPPVLSSKEYISAPTLLREAGNGTEGLKRFFTGNSQTTKGEYSMDVLGNSPELKKIPKDLTSGQIAMKRFKDREKAYRAKMRDRIKNR